MPKKILVVDDEAEIVSLLGEMLQENGYEVVSAMDGLMALKIARKEKPDLILLDLMLPKMDGYKVCAILKRDVKYAHIPILMLSARVYDENVGPIKELGADAYLTKPAEPKILLDKIRQLVCNEGQAKSLRE